MGILSFLRAVPSEPAIDWEAKFKVAAKDLADASFKIEALETEKAALLKEVEGNADTIVDLGAEVDALKADFNQRLADAVQDYQVDAEKFRAKAKADSNRAKNKRRDAAAKKGAGK